jgi:hypothetical protein
MEHSEVLEQNKYILSQDIHTTKVIKEGSEVLVVKKTRNGDVNICVKDSDGFEFWMSSEFLTTQKDKKKTKKEF